MAYMVASLAIYEGFVKEGLGLAKKAWDNATLNVLNPWNQPDTYSSVDGSYVFGDHYMRNMVVWSLLFALAKKDKQIVYIDECTDCDENNRPIRLLALTFNVTLSANSPPFVRTYETLLFTTTLVIVYALTNK